jgi:hypothetical protein
MTPNLKYFALFTILAFSLCACVTQLDAASNTILPAGGSDGAGEISGYIISDVSYGLGADPTKIEHVAITLNRSADQVFLRLSETQDNWHPCVNINGNRWECVVDNFPVAQATQLRVVASGQ